MSSFEMDILNHSKCKFGLHVSVTTAIRANLADFLSYNRLDSTVEYTQLHHVAVIGDTSSMLSASACAESWWYCRLIQ